MFSKEMEALIEAALQDGVLTDQEKSALIKRAQKEGIDIDELDIYIQSILQKRHQEKNALAEEEDRKAKMGGLKKCPHCGAVVQSLQGICEACGYVFREINASKYLEEFQKGLIAAQKRQNGDIIDEEYKRNESADERVTSFIETYPLPTSKADLLEFIIFLRPKAIDLIENSFLSNDYSNKYKECIEKINKVYRNDSDFEKYIVEFHDIIKKTIDEEKKSDMNVQKIAMGCASVPIIGGLVIYFTNSILLGIIAAIAAYGLVNLLSVKLFSKN